MFTICSHQGPTARAPPMQSERNIGQVDAKGSCAQEREPRRKRATTGLGGGLTSHGYRDGGAFAPKAVFGRKQQICRGLTRKL
jgi:hypothetical protein